MWTVTTLATLLQVLHAGDINRVDDPTGLTSVEVYNRKRKKWVFSPKIKVSKGYLIETYEHIFRYTIPEIQINA